MSKVYTPNLNTIADLVDRLIIDIHKLAYLENFKRDLQAKDGDAELIKRVDNASRNCCEIRSQLKNELNQTFADIFNAREYKPLEEVRTFIPHVVDALDRLCYKSANDTLKGDLAAAFERMFHGNKDK